MQRVEACSNGGGLTAARKGDRGRTARGQGDNALSLRMERQTRQRRAVTDVLRAATRPLSAAEVLRAAKRFVPGLGIATVYRSLRTLVDAGDVVPVAVAGSAPRYELSHLGHHHHFHCRRCRRVFEVHGCPQGVSQLAPKGFVVDGHDVVLFGRCQACA